LKNIRHRSIHFNTDVDTDDRVLALSAISKLTSIISRQFGSFGNQPWFIPGIKGASYIKKEAEEWPFVKRVYIPNSHLVGPLHKLGPVNGRMDLIHVYDDNNYENREISDDEFRSLLTNK
jgi:hypothetical protein